jgi:ferredoxin
MTRPTLQVSDKVILERSHLQELFDILRHRGYRVVGPTVREGAIVYDELRSVSDLPMGWTDEQDGGTYRLKRRSDEALFGYVVGPHSWKKFLHPPVMRLWQGKKKGQGFETVESNERIPKYAFIGVRSCELHAIAIQDRVFMGGTYVDPAYKARRERAFFVAVNCGQAGGTCFCVSMNTGPQATSGFDLALTEILDGPKHYFVLEVGTEQGADILREIPHQKASEQDQKEAESIVQRTAQQMGRAMDTRDIKELLYRNLEHPRWDEVANRCLTCGNCTMVCPTCFCTTVEDITDLTGGHAERVRKWDSCFTMDFSYIHGGSVRASPKSRYRQWMTHKLATWIDQFGTSGCVGCGRCITWCPVAIDITEEVRAIRESEPERKESADGTD